MKENITYGDACNIVAEAWNKEAEDHIPKFTGEEIWNFPEMKAFPALWLSRMYNAAKKGVLMGLILSDEYIAKMFFKAMERK